MISLPFFFHPLKFPSTRTILLFGPLSQNAERATVAIQVAFNRLMKWSKWRLLLNSLKCESSFFSLDPYQAYLKPFLSIFKTPFNFNPNSIFFGVTFDPDLSCNKPSSLHNHVLSLRKKFHSRFRAFRFIASASWGPAKESPCLLYKAFICSFLPMLPQAGFLSHPNP